MCHRVGGEGGGDKGPVGGCSSETYSHPIDMNNSILYHLQVIMPLLYHIYQNIQFYIL
jgi:hypothetical protein